MFGAGYPLLRAYPALDIVCLLVLRDHPWHRRVERALADLGVEPDADNVVCVQRIDAGLPWDRSNARVVELPLELRPLHRMEHDDWLSVARGAAR